MDRMTKHSEPSPPYTRGFVSTIFLIFLLSFNLIATIPQKENPKKNLKSGKKRANKTKKDIKGSLKVTVKKGQSIRDIAEQYLDDPNRWTDILTANNLTSVTMVRPGMKLKIPYNEITRANDMLVKALESIQEATKFKARVFAPQQIDRAVSLRDEALRHKKNSLWSKCFQLATQALGEAHKALEICRSRTNVPDMAVLNDRKGDVQGRKPSGLSWNDLPLLSTLIEGEKVRTLYKSFADILFHEGSHLRLDENSMAIIQQMRANLVANKKESSVSLVKGNIYALLSGSTNKKLKVNVQGVKTKVRSKNYWIEKKEKEVLLANYHGEIEVTARNSTVLLRKNKGTRVPEAQKPTRPVDLLKGPQLAEPKNNSLVYLNLKQKKTIFTWNPIPVAVAYNIEISLNDPAFNKIFLYRKDLKAPRLVLQRLKNGTYYWRVWAIDKNGFPGVKSKPSLVNVINDTSLPYIVIHSPKENDIIKENQVNITGETERGTTVTHNHQTIKLTTDGEFQFTVPLDREGKNVITLAVTDPAGNTNTISRQVIYLPPKALDIHPDSSYEQNSPGHIIIPDRGFTFHGRTVPGISIKVKEVDGSFKANIIAGKDGRFSISLFLKGNKGRYRFYLEDSAGRKAEKEFTFEVR
jgi:hypothetical protein